MPANNLPAIGPLQYKFEPLPMEAAIDYWRRLVPYTMDVFRTLSEADRAMAFAVSGLARQDEIDTALASLERAIVEGTTFKDFTADMADIMQARGWTAHRLENIFRTNIQTAYNVGRYKEMKDAAVIRPYWQYSAINDARTRPTHLALHGKVFPHDHPFWATWYPPNGYRCRCTVVTLAKADLKRLGLTVETGDPTGKLTKMVDAQGNELPARNLMPDPGFDHNPATAAWWKEAA